MSEQEMSYVSFEKIIQDDRESREKNDWNGTFLQYLQKVQENPTIVKLAHARLHDLIMNSGSSDILESDDSKIKRLFKDETVRVYNFFADEFFGIEKVIAQIARYFHSASLRGEESRQVL